jgi:succinate-acetate transporter protein
MSTVQERTRRAGANGHVEYEPHFEPRVFLQPIAAPSVLGLFGFAAATFMVAANLAGWYGNHTTTPLYLAPFAMIFGGVAQFMAGMWAYRARDVLATAMHGTWGSFWFAYGILEILIGTHAIAAPAAWYHQAGLGYWFFALAIVTASGALVSLGESLGLFSVLSTLAAGSGILAGAFLYGSKGWVTVAGWVLVFSAGFAWYTATAMMAASSTGRTILPLGKWSAKANVPGREPLRPIELDWAEPGVRQGQ